jgi:hypothetical protein
VASFQKVHASANQPIRVFLHHFAGLTSQGFNLDDVNSKRLLNQFGLRLKQMISRPSPHLDVPQCTLTLTLHQDLQRHGFYRILETVLADTLLSIDSFAGKVESVPIEYRSQPDKFTLTMPSVRYFCGFLFVLKMQQVSLFSFISPSLTHTISRSWGQ